MSPSAIAVVKITFIVFSINLQKEEKLPKKQYHINIKKMLTVFKIINIVNFKFQ